ncbi:MAG: glutathionylspermidine synthase family protein [Phycisphaerae bacterium]|nr:glutathionylspermidine synthase family protein [Phycisphaerae bacterium]
MNPPWTVSDPIPDAQFRELRLRMIFDHHKWDSQFEDIDSIGRRVLVLDGSAWDQLRLQSEQLWAEALAAEEEILCRPDLCRMLGLGRRLQKACTRTARQVPATAMARVMRFDFHFTEEGWRISEANSDVPGGFIESCAFAEFACKCHPGTCAAPDVGRLYAKAVASSLGRGARVAFVHATAYTDDRQVMVFLAERFAAEGLVPELVSPADLVWDRLRTPLPMWKALLPQTRDPREVDWRKGDDWVLKPALGRVGEWIGIRGVTADKEWREIARHAAKYPGFWAAQRRFQAIPVVGGNENLYPCVGVFVVDGKACGLYGRAASVPLIDSYAQEIAVLIGSDVSADRKTQTKETSVVVLGERG